MLRPPKTPSSELVAIGTLVPQTRGGAERMARDLSLSEIIRGALDARLGDVNVAMVGKVLKYDPIQQVVEVLPVVQRAFNVAGETAFETIAPIPNVPVLFPRTRSHFIHVPIVPEDHVLLVFCDADIGNWRETGSVSKPAFLGRHGMGSAIAIPGIAPATSPLTDAPLPAMDPTEAVLGGGTWRVGGKATALPVARSEPLMAVLDALAAWVTAANTILPLVPNTTDEQKAAVVTATTNLTATLTAAKAPVTGIESSKLKAE